jgi:hypothetical protein
MFDFYVCFFSSKKPVKLTMNIADVGELPPRELVTYSKETQTPATEVAEGLLKGFPRFF